MGRALTIRQDFTADDLRQLARKSRDAAWSRRLLALSVIYDGGSRSQAASMGGVGLQIVRDWVERFNRNGPDGLRTEKAKGRARLLNEKQRKALVARGRERSRSLSRRRGAVEARRSGALALAGASHLREPPDARARTECDGLSQTHRPAQTSRAGPSSHGGF